MVGSAAADLWQGGEALLLASTSPTRRALLEAVGLPVEVRPPGVDERALEADAPPSGPGELALRLARAKALAVARGAPERVVVGADQVLALGEAVLHRAPDAGTALAALARLAGRTHELYSAFALARGGRVVGEGTAVARLTMRPLDRAGLEAYARAAGPTRLTASVGGYQVEGPGLHLFERIEGDHSTILGLPLIPLLAALRAERLLSF